MFRSLIARRFASTAASSASSKSIFNNSAKHLVALKQAETGKQLSQAEADAEAVKWIESIENIRKEFTEDGKSSFSPSKSFAPENANETEDFNFVKYAEESFRAEGLHKFKPTQEQTEQLMNLKHKAIPLRNDETINYLTNIIMKNGLKARAQRTISQALYLVHLKTRLDPIEQLKDVLDRMGPLMKLRRYTDGGARSEMVPAPLTERQRIRQAWLWILEAAKKRGSKDFSVRLSEEILAAIQGKSPGFEKKIQQHKLAIVNRSYISLVTKKKRGRR